MLRRPLLGSIDPLLVLLQSDSLLHEAIRSWRTITASQLSRRRGALIRIIENGGVSPEFAILIRLAVPLATSLEFLTDAFDTIISSSNVDTGSIETASSVLVGDRPTG